MDGIWGWNASWLGRSYCKKSSIRRVRKYYFNFFSAKNAKPFRVSKNGNTVDVIKKIEFAPHQSNQNNIRIQLRRGNIVQIQNNNEPNNIEIENNSEINI